MSGPGAPVAQVGKWSMGQVAQGGGGVADSHMRVHVCWNTLFSRNIVISKKIKCANDVDKLFIEKLAALPWD